MVENFRPGVAAKLGIDYESMKAVKPDIIMASLSGYGQTVPMPKRELIPIWQKPRAASCI